MLTVSQKWY